MCMANVIRSAALPLKSQLWRILHRINNHGQGWRNSHSEQNLHIMYDGLHRWALVVRIPDASQNVLGNYCTRDRNSIHLHGNSSKVPRRWKHVAKRATRQLLVCDLMPSGCDAFGRDFSTGRIQETPCDIPAAAPSQLPA